ncbi:hypothetical protein GCM10008018_72760 [Paenibacillus marchantiophytorum]|uniref:Uncharacterized protein n=1 Tax=Paenibacillus marchantiophytorum TaxID=1619310 RepID=A0ABQ1FKG4_9BACL|nr:hypothetical protein [Paenibacillus marchantiophytorum]GGA18250.1 hypothetical protein GCM10008018_72760 [Paenibacillus marchantiophytorum]
MNMDYLSYEDQFKKELGQEEISRIINPEIREIREKYLRMQRAAFENERDIPDSELSKVSNELIRQEQEELQRYKDKKQRYLIKDWFYI